MLHASTRTMLHASNLPALLVKQIKQGFEAIDEKACSVQQTSVWKQWLPPASRVLPQVDKH